MSFLFRRFRYDKTYKPQPGDTPFTTKEKMVLASLAAMYFLSFFAFYFLINLTFISPGDVIGKYLFFVLISLVVLFFYFRSKKMTEYVFSLLISFGVSGPFAVVLLLTLNFLIVSPYAVQTFAVPDDFELNEGKRVFELPLNEELAILGMPRKFEISIFEMQKDAELLTIELGIGFFGYHVIKSKRFE
jgi:hypothetical protein